MSKAWMPMYWGDYLADTLHLSTIQHGAYLLLIAHYWQHGGLPNDEKALAFITKLDLLSEWKNNVKALASLFSPGWRHKRIDDELAKVETLRKIKSLAGRQGGRPRKKQMLSVAPRRRKSISLQQSQSPKNLSSINSESEIRPPEEPSTATATALFEGAPSPVSENPEESKKAVADKKNSLAPSPHLVALMRQKLNGKDYH